MQEAKDGKGQKVNAHNLITYDETQMVGNASIFSSPIGEYHLIQYLQNCYLFSVSQHVFI